MDKNIKKPRGKAALITDKCIACGARCQASCLFEAIEMNDKGEPIIFKDKCTACQKCIKVCPAEAIELMFTPEEQEILKLLEEQKKVAGAPAVEENKAPAVKPEDAALAAKLAEYRGVWVFVENNEGIPAKVSWELLGIGKELALSLGVELCAVVVGEQVETLCNEAFSYGAQKVYLFDAPLFKNYRTEPYLEAFTALISKYKPEVILMGATGMGRDLAGAVATKIGAGLTADCTGLAIDEERNLAQTRPAFGGNIMATIICKKNRPQMATVRPHVMPMPARQEGNKGLIIRETIDLKEEAVLTKVLEIISDAGNRDRIDIAGAEFIVSGGRGMMGKENFYILEELAQELGGVVGSSRSAVDAGWMPVERQVGQTGKTVRPKIYIACGISGAIQHLVGMQNSEIIIAINRDKDAPIFSVATYGIVGDLFKVIPAITARLREMKEEKKKTGSVTVR